MQKQNFYKSIFTEYPDLVNINQMCKMLGGISIKTGYSLLKEDRIKSLKIGRAYKIPKINIINFLSDSLMKE